MKKLAILACSLIVIGACSEPGTTQEQSQAADASKPAAAASKPAAPAAPRTRTVTIPAGTAISLTLDTAVASNTSKPEDAVQAKLAQAIVVGGETVVPAGTLVTGIVADAKESGRVKGLASVSLDFDKVRIGNVTHTIKAARITKEAEPTKAKDAEKIGVGAAAGAIIGAIAGGGKGAATGAAVGAGAGTGVVLATKGEEISLPAGTTLDTTLETPLALQVAAK